MPGRALLAFALISVVASCAREGGSAPISGTFEVVTSVEAKTGKKTDVRADLQRTGGGAVLLGFDGVRMTLATWAVTANVAAPEDVASVCRARATIPVDWSGARLRAPALDVAGMADGAHVVRKIDDAHRDVSRNGTGTTCDASLAGGDYALEILEKDATGPVRIRLSHPERVLELVRAAPIDQLDVIKLQRG